MPHAVSCSFCGKSDKQHHDIFIHGKSGCICGNCAENASTVARREKGLHGKSKEAPIEWRALKPAISKAYLDKYIIGQEHAKKAISIALYNHCKRLEHLRRQKQAKDTPIELDKSNILMVGPTGVGKTLIIKTITRLFQLPFITVDATKYTGAGIAGDNVEDIITRLLQDADYNISTAEKGVIYIDEFDKITCNQPNSLLTHDIGKGVQQALLKIIEGSRVSVLPDGGRRHGEQQPVTVDTTNILFICGGSFEGLHAIIQERLHMGTVGFDYTTQTTQKSNPLAHVTAADLKAYGFIPELVSRLSLAVSLEPLTREMLKEILLKPKNAPLRQMQALFAMDGTQLHFTSQAIQAIADKAFDMKVGARALRNILEQVLFHAMFHLPSQRHTRDFTVDAAYVAAQLAGKPFKPPSHTLVANG